MLQIFKTEDGKIGEVEEVSKNCWVALTDPSSAEIRKISREFDIDEDDLRAPLDEEERSRIDIEDNYVMILVDIPVIEERNDKDWYGTIPMSIILTNDSIITICLQDTPILEAFINGRVRRFHTYMKTRFVLQILYKNASLYLQYLRNIDKKSEEIEHKLHESPKNKEIIELLEMQKSLQYFTTSLRSNEAVLERIVKIERIKMYPEDADYLEDVITENKQAIEMAGIYSGILGSTMDAVASVINNNVNNVMKYLASITIVMSIPNIIAGLYGMNVDTAGMPFANSTWGFLIVCLIALGITLTVALIFSIKKLL